MCTVSRGSPVADETAEGNGTSVKSARKLAALQVKARQLWGSAFYTHDSDLVAVLMHCGYVSNIAGVPVNSVQEMRVAIQYQPSRPFYPSVLKNGIRSRAWGMHIDGCCFKVQIPNPLWVLPSSALHWILSGPVIAITLPLVAFGSIVYVL